MALLATVLDLQNRDRSISEAEEDQTAFVTRWRTDIGAVYETIRAALEPLKARDLVAFATASTTVTEEPLGEYEVDELVITIVGRTITVVPAARFTVGGTGRLDMFRDDRPSMDDRLLIVRGSEEAGHVPDVWLIEDRREFSRAMRKLAVMTGTAGTNRGSRLYRPLAQDAIQDAVEYLLTLA